MIRPCEVRPDESGPTGQRPTRRYGYSGYGRSDGEKLMEKIFVSIDGPTASGKTTLGASLAHRLGAAFLDTGLTFRALAYALARDDIGPEGDWRSSIEHRPLVYGPRGDHLASDEVVLYQGKDVTAEIWDVGLDDNLRLVAGSPAWRAEILRLHREIVATYQRLVTVGRDVATTLLPSAALNVYLTASLAVRRERRRAQHRSLPSRSVVVTRATELDLETRIAIRAMPNALDIDSTYLPAVAVLSRTLRKLGVDS